ncbi:MAG TPA: hypothetical protein VMK82_08155 [Steroidobacteraceae bacterium]|nr:hypothetical protein [Steroidobacteraceae bacterium]
MLLLAAPTLMAQSGPDAQAGQPAGMVPVIEDGRRIYTVGQFARFAPQTAADLVGQIPGFSVTSVSNERGLGEATQNVLINGQRITGKGNDAMGVLRRIPVSAVLRLEILDGAMLDISGLSGQVLNVLTEHGGVQGNFAWRPQFRERIPAHWSAGEVNVSGKANIGDYTLGLRWDGFRGGGWGGQTEVRPADGISFWRTQSSRVANDSPRLSGSFNRKTAAGSIWNLNASLQREHFRRYVPTTYQLPGDPLTTEISRGSNRKWRSEIGADYEFSLGTGRLKLVGFFFERAGPNSNELTRLKEGQTVPTGTRFTRDSTEGERVGRAEYRWRALDSDWNLSAESVHNFVDATGALAMLDTKGEYQPEDLPGATSRVEELRGESILSFSRPLSAGWSLQISGGGEFSRLHQDGENGQTRSFWRPKGSVSLAWNPASPWEMNLRLQRKVGQLNFFDFLVSVDVNNDNSDGANPALVPPQSWVAQFETVRSLGAHGKVTLDLEAERIGDHVDQVPISPTAEAPGNLPSARRLQASLDAGLLLDAVGIPGGKLDAFVTVRDTRVRDPLFGTYRELGGNRSYWNVDFRHDLPGTMWTWGLSAEKQSKNYSWRLDSEEVSYDSRPSGAIFLEHKDVWSLKVRVTISNLFNSKDRRQFVSYVDRRNGPVEYSRDSYLTYHSTYRLAISGTF